MAISSFDRILRVPRNMAPASRLLSLSEPSTFSTFPRLIDSSPIIIYEATDLLVEGDQGLVTHRMVLMHEHI